MICYHGGPITPNAVAISLWKRRHAMVSFARPDQIGIAAEVSESFAVDNGAFSVWRQGLTPDWEGYADWVHEWSYHPGFDWAIIPDSIEGNEAENDALIAKYSSDHINVPVWHLHESPERLGHLVGAFARVALGSSGKWSDPGSPAWWARITEVSSQLFDGEGRPYAKLHGLRMMNASIFSHIPFSSVDSTNIARNHAREAARYKVSSAVAAEIMNSRLEQHASAARWTGSAGVRENQELFG